MYFPFIEKVSLNAADWFPWQWENWKPFRFRTQYNRNLGRMHMLALVHIFELYIGKFHCKWIELILEFLSQISWYVIFVLLTYDYLDETLLSIIIKPVGCNTQNLSVSERTLSLTWAVQSV